MLLLLAYVNVKFQRSYLKGLFSKIFIFLFFLLLLFSFLKSMCIIVKRCKIILIAFFPVGVGSFIFDKIRRNGSSSVFFQQAFLRLKSKRCLPLLGIVLY